MVLTFLLKIVMSCFLGAASASTTSRATSIDRLIYHNHFSYRVILPPEPPAMTILTIVAIILI